jgi:hypothetical protein
MQCQVGAAQPRNGSVVSSAFLSLQARWFARFFGWEESILTWLGFSAVTLIINQALMFQK